MRIFFLTPTMPRKSCANQNRRLMLMLLKSNVPPTFSGRKNMIRNVYSDDNSPLTGTSFSSYYVSSTNKIFRYSFEPTTPMTDGTTTAPSPPDTTPPPHRWLRIYHITWPNWCVWRRLPDCHHLNLSHFSGQWPRPIRKMGSSFRTTWNSSLYFHKLLVIIFSFKTIQKSSQVN